MKFCKIFYKLNFVMKNWSEVLKNEQEKKKKNQEVPK